MSTKKAGVRIAIGSDFDPKGFIAAEKRTAALKEMQLANSGTMAGAWVASGRAMQTFGSQVGAVGQSMSGVGDKLTTSVTLPLVGIGAYAFKTAADFEQSMNLVQAATGAPSAQMDKLSTLAKKMGADTVYSANEAGGAMLELAKSGMTPAQIAGGALASSLQLAAAGQISLESAATTTANAINMFGLQASDAASVADALAGGANASSASVDSLQQALSQVGPGARNAGLNLQDTVGVLAAFADRGIQGSDAGTSLKTMLSRLIPTTSAAADAMDKYNLSFSDSKGNIDDITVVAQKLQDKLGGLSEAQRSAALTQIFGSDATRAASVMMELGAKGTRKYIDATKDREAAERMADAAMKGSKGTIEQMRGSVETAALSIGQSLAPTIIKAADAVKGLADKFSALDSSQQEQIVKWLAIAAVVWPVLSGFGRLITSVSTIINFGGHAAVQIGKMGAQIAGLNANSIAASQGLTTMSRATMASSAGYLALAAAVGFAIGNMINQIPWVIEKQKALGESIGELVYQHKAGQIASDATVAKWKAEGIQLDENNNITEVGVEQLKALNNEHAREQVAVGTAGFALQKYREELVRVKDEQEGAERADIALERAKLRQASAQKALTKAIKDFGKNSPEAKSAALDLRSANLDLADAEDDAAAAQKTLTDAIKKFPRPNNKDAQSWMNYYQQIGDKAAYAAAKSNAANKALSGGKGAGSSGRKQIPVYGAGADLTNTGTHLAMVGDTPEIIFPMGDASFAAKYLPVLLSSLPSPSTSRGGSAPSAAVSVASAPSARQADQRPVIVQFHQQVRSYSETLRAIRDAQEAYAW